MRKIKLFSLGKFAHTQHKFNLIKRERHYEVNTNTVNNNFQIGNVKK